MARGYSYQGFYDSVKHADRAGHIVSLPGRRVLHLERAAEIHVEHLP